MVIFIVEEWNRDEHVNLKGKVSEVLCKERAQSKVQIAGVQDVSIFCFSNYGGAKGDQLIDYVHHYYISSWQT